MTMTWKTGILAMLILAAVPVMPLAGLAAPPADIRLFAPAREADKAIQAARQARAMELAPQDIRLASLYAEDAKAALQPPSPDVEKATRLFRLAAAQARLAETRAIEVARERRAADAGFQFLEAIEGDTGTLRRPSDAFPLPQPATEYPQLRREAARVRAARRAAEETVNQLERDGR